MEVATPPPGPAPPTEELVHDPLRVLKAASFLASWTAGGVTGGGAAEGGGTEETGGSTGTATWVGKRGANGH